MTLEESCLKACVWALKTTVISHFQSFTLLCELFLQKLLEGVIRQELWQCPNPGGLVPSAAGESQALELLSQVTAEQSPQRCLGTLYSTGWGVHKPSSCSQLQHTDSIHLKHHLPGMLKTSCLKCSLMKKQLSFSNTILLKHPLPATGKQDQYSQCSASITDRLLAKVFRLHKPPLPGTPAYRGFSAATNPPSCSVCASRARKHMGKEE